MSSKDRIFETISKKGSVELSKEEIALGIVDDVSLDVEAIVTGIKRNMGDYLDLKKKADSLRNGVGTYDNRVKDAENKLSSIKSSIKTLGIDTPKEVMNAEKDLIKAKSALNTFKKDLKSI